MPSSVSAPFSAILKRNWPDFPVFNLESGSTMIHWLAHKLGLRTCPECETLVEYALEGLDPRQWEKVRRHLAECPPCLEQVRDFWQVREGLGLCAPECEPPEDFSARVLARLHESDVSRMPLDKPRQRLDGWPRFWMTLGPVFALMSVIMTGVAALAIVGRGGATKADNELARLGQELMDDPHAVRVTLFPAAGRGASRGELLLCPGKSVAFLRAERLSKCPQGNNYAIWEQRSGAQPRRLARFSVEADGSSRHLLNLDGPWTGGTKLSFSLTQDSGSQPGELWLSGGL
jgi:hypothetical protein